MSLRHAENGKETKIRSKREPNSIWKRRKKTGEEEKKIEDGKVISRISFLLLLRFAKKKKKI